MLGPRYVGFYKNKRSSNICSKFMTPIGIGSGLRSSVAGHGDDSEDKFARVRLLERIAGLMLELVHDASVGEDSSYRISASALSPRSTDETAHQEIVLRAVREMAHECPPSVWLALAHTNTFQVCRVFPERDMSLFDCNLWF